MQEPELAARAGGEEGDATVYSRDGMCDSRRHVMTCDTLRLRWAVPIFPIILAIAYPCLSRSIVNTWSTATADCSSEYGNGSGVPVKSRHMAQHVLCSFLSCTLSPPSSPILLDTR